MNPAPYDEKEHGGRKGLKHLLFLRANLPGFGRML
jgi:hypothetical protein